MPSSEITNTTSITEGVFQKSKASKQNKSNVDISDGLPSLQFETALTEDQLRLLHLRTRAHCITTAALCTACYFTRIYNQLRKEIFIVKHASKAAQRIMQAGIDGDPARIGIVGCGRLGRQLVQALMFYANVQPQFVYISTRRPESLQLFVKDGTKVDFNNSWLAEQCDLIFLCCLPAAAQQICSEMKNHLTRDKLIYSFISGVPAKKISSMLNFPNVIKPEFLWNESSFHSNWDVSELPYNLLNYKQLMVKFCPLYDRENAGTSESWNSTSNNDDVMDDMTNIVPPVWLDVGWVMKIMFACINFATTQQVTTDVVVDTINKVFFLTPKSELLEGKDLLLEEHVTLPVDHVVCHLFDTLQEGDENGSQVGSSAYLEQTNVSMRQSTPVFAHFPYWDLTVIESGNALAEALLMNKRLKHCFLRRFSSTFERIIQF